MFFRLAAISIVVGCCIISESQSITTANSKISNTRREIGTDDEEESQEHPEDQYHCNLTEMYSSTVCFLTDDAVPISPDHICKESQGAKYVPVISGPELLDEFQEHQEDFKWLIGPLSDYTIIVYTDNKYDCIVCHGTQGEYIKDSFLAYTVEETDDNLFSFDQLCSPVATKPGFVLIGSGTETMSSTCS